MDESNTNSDFKATADVSARRISRVYAEALLNAAEQRNEVDSVIEEFDSLFTDVFKADPQFEVILSSSALGRRARSRVIDSVFKDRASELFHNFLRVLNEHERLDLLRPIFVAMRELNDERRRRIRVEVVSAAPLGDDQKQRLEQLLTEGFQLHPILETRVDPELLGGMRVRVGDWLYDASVITELENIRSQILSRGSYEIQSGRERFSSAEGN